MFKAQQQQTSRQDFFKNEYFVLIFRCGGAALICVRSSFLKLAARPSPRPSGARVPGQRWRQHTWKLVPLLRDGEAALSAVPVYTYRITTIDSVCPFLLSPGDYRYVMCLHTPCYAPSHSISTSHIYTHTNFLLEMDLENSKDIVCPMKWIVDSNREVADI